MNKERKVAYILTGVAAVLFAALGYLYYQSSSSLSSTKAELGAKTKEAAALAEELATTKNDAYELSEALAAEQSKNQAFEDQIRDISGTVGKLDKLSKTDPELLQKYSKVYFLNENYTPSALTQISQDFVADDRDEYFQKEAYRFLKNLLEDAKDDGIDLAVTSAYRSFGTQAVLKSNYKLTYGSGANAFSADQGYSEHQLGTAVDFTSKEIGGALTISFESTKAAAWLNKHAVRYGFILSYPKGNAYYQYEPWHWRFVGRDLAERLQDDEKNFYDLDQRELDPYLINLFD